MPPKSFKPNHLELRYRTYSAVLMIPKDVRHIFQKSRFSESLGTSDLRSAQALATIKVIKWKGLIASARAKSNDPIINSAIELSRMQKSSPPELVREIIDEETARIAYESGNYSAEAFHEIATGKSKALLGLIDAWVKNEERRNLKEKTIAQMKSDVEVLVQSLATVSSLTPTNSSLWLQLIAKQENLSPASITRIVGSCKNFHRYLKQAGEIDAHAPDPFVVPNEFKLSKKRNSKALNKTESWKPFDNADVVHLYAHALQDGDESLGNLICIGAYTGARIEEICSLKKKDVNLISKSIKITDAKTEAGLREIPIHTKLLQLIKKLIKNNGEYLIPNLTLNKFGDRSNAIGKRFGRLKRSLGYSKSHVFHSIRKTFTTQLENASVLENITADIIGHEKPRMTYGLYSGGTTLEVKRKAIAKVKYDFRDPKKRVAVMKNSTAPNKVKSANILQINSKAVKARSKRKSTPPNSDTAT